MTPHTPMHRSLCRRARVLLRRSPRHCSFSTSRRPPGFDPREAFAATNHALRFFLVGFGFSFFGLGAVCLWQGRRIGVRREPDLSGSDTQPRVRPGEKVPPLGASRHYVKDDARQAAVREALPKAAPVVVRLGDTPGVWWELQQAVESVRPERLLLIVPADRNRHANVRARLARLLPHDLPPFESGPPVLGSSVHTATRQPERQSHGRDQDPLKRNSGLRSRLAKKGEKTGPILAKETLR
jgi:hypothetical protein